MEEHRLIEKMIALVGVQEEKFKLENKADVNFIAIALDKKPLSPENKRTLRELRDEHGQARKTVVRLADAGDRYAAGSQGTFTEVLNSMLKSRKKCCRNFGSMIEP